VSTKMDQFYDNLRDGLDTVEGRLKSVRTKMQALREQGEKALREKLDGARHTLQSQKERGDQTRANLKARAEQKMHDIKEAVSEWKAKRETRKLNARADRAEAYAADAIDFVVASIDEAELAILDAVMARIDADADAIVHNGSTLSRLLQTPPGRSRRPDFR
jgi:chromosome segregation ATPase